MTHLLRGSSLLAQLLAEPAHARDAWVDALLGMPEAPEEEALPRGGVPYVPCEVDDIVAMVRELPLRTEDTLVDLGSGLGRVALIGHLLSGARAHGIEFQPGLVQLAQARARALGLARVTFTQGDAAEAPLEGTVFFLYSPFNGETLTRVLQRLKMLAKERSIAVCCVDMELASERWLRARSTSRAGLTIYRSVTGTRM
ncbi:MAG: methyltransferase domain-containing protein [Myxococcaceae bacterium]|nr:methyltransferase domain-containing protein [Myxococcaceae bacterium]